MPLKGKNLPEDRNALFCQLKAILHKKVLKYLGLHGDILTEIEIKFQLNSLISVLQLAVSFQLVTVNIGLSTWTSAILHLFSFYAMFIACKQVFALHNKNRQMKHTEKSDL